MSDNGNARNQPEGEGGSGNNESKQREPDDVTVDKKAALCLHR